VLVLLLKVLTCNMEILREFLIKVVQLWCINIRHLEIMLSYLVIKTLPSSWKSCSNIYFMIACTSLRHKGATLLLMMWFLTIYKTGNFKSWYFCPGNVSNLSLAIMHEKAKTASVARRSLASGVERKLHHVTVKMHSRLFRLEMNDCHWLLLR